MFGLAPLQPAYGRDYKTLKAAQKDFDDGKDFRTPFGQYTSKREIQRMHPGLRTITVRYAKARKVGKLKL